MCSEFVIAGLGNIYRVSEQFRALADQTAPPPTPAREAPGNQSWKSNFLAIIGISLQLILSTFQEAITARKLLLAVGF
jgi:hypothetical protein